MFICDTYAKEDQKIPKAFSEAYHNFAKNIRGKYKGNSRLEKHVSNIENYKMAIYQSGESIVIDFHPQPLNGMTLCGGGGKYIIDAKTLKILKIEFYR
jgi:hypothetical protein